MKDSEKDEGARSFSNVLAMIADGKALEDASAEQHELLVALHEEAQTARVAKGKFTLELAYKVEHNGIVGIAYDIKVKKPARAREGSVLWLSKGKNLTNKNPRQQELPLREVTTPRDAAPREVSEASSNLREV